MNKLGDIWFWFVTNPLQERRKDRLFIRFMRKQLKMIKVKLSVKEFFEKYKDDEKWFERYEITEEQYDRLKKFVTKLFKKAFPWMNDRHIEHNVGMFLLDKSFKFKINERKKD